MEDWLYAYDKLVKPFEPSVILVFLGGNNINDMGHTGEYAASLMANLLNKMHTDFPGSQKFIIFILWLRLTSIKAANSTMNMVAL